MALPVALQLYSVREAMADDFEGTLRKVKAMGYAGIEFAGLFEKTPEYVNSIINDIGLVPVSAHVPIGEMLTDPKKVMKTYSEIGCRFIAIPYLPEELRPEKGDFAKTLEDIRFIGKIAKENGIALLYHNHDFEFLKVDGEYYLDTIYRSVPADLLQTEIDTCWVNVAGEDPSEYILKYSGRSPIVHLKDFVMKGRGKGEKLYELIGIKSEDKVEKKENFSFRPVGYGAQDVQQILDASVNAGAKWIVVEQDKPASGQTELESAELSRNYLKSLGW